MNKLTWSYKPQPTMTLLSVIVIVVTIISSSNSFPQPQKDAAAPSVMRDLSEMDEDLVTDSDAEFESTKIIRPEIETSPSNQESRVQGNPEPLPDSQNFFPSFASIFPSHPLGHSRPPVYDDPPINNHRPRHIPYALQQANSFQGPSDGFSNNNYNHQPLAKTTAVAATEQNNVLGSGNFGVIRGGTFFEDDYDNDDYYYPYNNGHGRPSNSYYNHQPAANHQTSTGDYFSNFRDFADITAPKAAFSEFHVIYVNKNGTEVDPSIVGGKPRNIFEQLTRLDESESKLKLNKKGINHKEKLALHKEKESEKFYKKKQNISGVKEIYHEPLLALS